MHRKQMYSFFDVENIQMFTCTDILNKMLKRGGCAVWILCDIKVSGCYELNLM